MTIALAVTRAAGYEPISATVTRAAGYEPISVVVTKETVENFGADLLLNGSFETAGAGGADVFASWGEVVADGAIERSNAYAMQGTYSAKITAGPGLDTLISQYATVVPGTQYRFEFWTQGSGTVAGRYAVYDNTHDAFIQIYISTSIIGAAWATIITDFWAPAGCVSVGLFLRCPEANGAAAYFDWAHLREKI